MLAVLHFLQQYDEFIATQPGDHVTASHRLFETLTHFLQYQIAGPMTERIDDVLETVQINQQH